MDHDTLILNLIGTAYNVLLEQNHPNEPPFRSALSEHFHAVKGPDARPGWGTQFDLRERDITGAKL